MCNQVINRNLPKMRARRTLKTQ